MKLMCILVALVVLGGCANARYHDAANVAYAHYEVAGFDHLPEPDRTIMSTWFEARKATVFPRVAKVREMVAAFRSTAEPADKLALVRRLLSAILKR